MCGHTVRIPPRVSTVNLPCLGDANWLSMTNFVNSLIPFPLISASEPSGLNTLIRTCAMLDSSSSTMPSDPIPKAGLLIAMDSLPQSRSLSFGFRPSIAM